jgi:hypothetical protein
MELLAQPGVPTTFAGLADRLEVRADRTLAAALARRDSQQKVVHFRAGGSKSVPTAEDPVYPVAALDLPEVVEHVLRHGLQRYRTTSTTAFTPYELSKKFRGASGRRVKDMLEQALQQGSLPPGLGAVRRRGHVYVFRLESVITGARNQPTRPEPDPSQSVHPREPPRTGHDFRSKFDTAFKRLDAEGRGLNFVKLHDLRLSLPEYDRTAFDAGLRQLRIEGRYELNTAEGSHRRLTDDEREAGIVEAGTRLVYCQRIR